MGGEGKRGGFGTRRVFFSVGVKEDMARHGKAWQGKENKCCIPQPIPKIPESPKCMKRFWRRGIKRGCWVMCEMSVAGGQGGSGWV